MIVLGTSNNDAIIVLGTSDNDGTEDQYVMMVLGTSM